jgi:hypothetical protein
VNGYDQPQAELQRIKWRRCALIVLLAGATLLSSGCVRRRLNVRSNPPGAMVFVDNQQIGTTPCSVDFIYYGTREIRLVKPGFETLTVNQPIPMPWYQIPPIDFVSENLIPKNIQDHRTVAFDLQPQIIVPTEQLLDRANQLRQETMQGAVVPASAAVPPPPVALPPTSLPPGPFVTPPEPAPITLPPAGAAPMPTFSSPAPATQPPFAAPDLPPAQPFSPPQGAPIVSPPLR